MANTTKNILNAVKAILVANATVAAYNHAVDLGQRDNIPNNMFPTIMVEVADETEVVGTLGKRSQLKISLIIACVIRNEIYDNTLIGDANQKGILDFVADVKNALEVYRDLNYDATVQRVDRFNFPVTKYVFNTHPFRSAEIQMDCYRLLTGATAR